MIGVDIIKISRIKKAIDRWGRDFIERVFSEEEINYCEGKRDRYQCYAVRFSAKEAFFKAFNHSFGYSAVEVYMDEKPGINILNNDLKELLKNKTVSLSLAHSEDTGIATVFIQED